MEINSKKTVGELYDLPLVHLSSSEALTAFEDGNDLQAARLFKEELRDCPIDAEALFYLGKIYARKGDEIEAIRFFKQSLAYRQNHAQTLFELAKSSLKCSRYSEAEDCFLQAIEIKADLFKAYSALASYYYQMGLNPDTSPTFSYN